MANEKEGKVNKGGRKGKYHDWITQEGLTVLRGWARDGYTDKGIAEKMDIHVSTLYEWKNRYPELDDALKKGKEIIDNEAEEALIKSMLGYEYKETKKYVDEKGNRKVEEYTKHCQPNVTAIIWWLKNRRPESWRDRRESDVRIKGDTDLMDKAAKIREYLSEGDE